VRSNPSAACLSQYLCVLIVRPGKKKLKRKRGVAHAAREAGEDRVRSQRGQGGEPKAGSQGESEDPDGRVSKWVCN